MTCTPDCDLNPDPKPSPNPISYFIYFCTGVWDEFLSAIKSMGPKCIILSTIYCFPQNMMLQIPRFLHPKIFLFHPWINWSNNSPIHPSIYPSIHSSIHPSIHPNPISPYISLHQSIQPTFLFFYSSMQLTIQVSVLSKHPYIQFIYSSTYQSPFTRTMCTHLYPSIRPSIQPSVHPSKHTFSLFISLLTIQVITTAILWNTHSVYTYSYPS